LLRQAGIEEVAGPFGNYVALAPEENLVAALAAEGERTAAFLAGVPAADELRLHPPYAWTFRQVVGHLADAERVFGYRALRFARGDATPLPGFDENLYVANADFDRVPLTDLAAEFAALRASHVRMFNALPALAWERGGVAAGAALTVRLLARAILGHERHHLAILRRRLERA
jgi:hypothetical protein